MDLSRQEYPALLTSLQPGQAVTVLNDRINTINRVNQDVVDWLMERRMVEENYISGLKRLAAKRLESTSHFGVLQTPWQSIITMCEAVAESHQALMQRINADVEKPLRDYASKNKDMSNIKTVQGNLSSLAKDVDEAQKKSDKLMSKGNKADNAKLSSALSTIQEAQQQWESQAPYVFEQLQALDESRINHLRDVLTQLQTHETDQLERARTVVASSLEAILNVDTTEEISSFVARTTGAAPNLPSAFPNARRMSRHSTSSVSRPATVQSAVAAAAASAPPVPEVPRSLTVPLTASTGRRGSGSPSGQESREGSAAPDAPTPKKSGLGGLRRLGTVMKRSKDKDKEKEKPAPGPSAEKKKSRNPLKRGTSNRDTMYRLGSPSGSMTELADTSSTLPSQTTATATAAQPIATTTNGAPAEQAVSPIAGLVSPPSVAAASHTNGSAVSPDATRAIASTKEPETAKEPERTSSAVDDITRAEQEAAAASGEAQSFNVNIRNEPIPEEDGDAVQAINDTANILRQGAQPPTRKVGTVRGRRDVRNTMFVPSNVAADLANIGGESALASPPTDGVRTGALTSSTLLAKPEDGSSGDAQSIRSARSLSSMGPAAIKHPELTAPGMNASIVETVSATLTNGQVTKATVIGEIALAYNGEAEAAAEAGETPAQTLRLDNFQVLEKVAPNPGFITPLEDRTGEYAVQVGPLSRGGAQIGFKYQVHLEETNLGSFAPVLLTPMWKVEAAQTSVILNYAFNPAFGNGAGRAVLHNAVVTIGIDGAAASGCQSKPSGTFSRDKGMIYWRLGDVTLEGEGSGGGKLLARFTTDGQATPGAIEARWEMASSSGSSSGSSSSSTGNGNGEGATTATVVGSGLGLSIGTSEPAAGAGASAANPFEEAAGEDGAAAAAATTAATASDAPVAAATKTEYKEVPVHRKLISGKYVATKE